MLIYAILAGKQWGGSKSFIVSIEAYPVVTRLERVTVKKAQAKVVKCAKDVGSLETPFDHLGANLSVSSFPICELDLKHNLFSSNFACF